MESHDDDYASERTTNLLATYAGQAFAAADPSTVEVHKHDELDAYEQCYNLAGVALAQGRAVDAIKLLEQSMEWCREMLEEDPDTTEEEIEDELLLLRVQMGVALQSMGKEAEASSQFSTILKQKPDDAVLTAIAAINMVALNRERNVFDSRKKMNLVKMEEVGSKFTTSQKKSVDVNQALLLLHMNQNDACRKKLEEAGDKIDSDVSNLIKASLLYREKKKTQGFAELIAYAEANPETATRTKVAIAQMHLLEGDVEESIAVLESIASLQNKPGLVGALVALHTAAGDAEKAAAVLDAAIQYTTEAGEGGEQLENMLKAGAEFKFNNGMFTEAGALYKQLLETNPEDGVVLTKLIACLTEYDIEEAEQYSEQLPPLEYDTAEVDVEALEKAGTKRMGRKTAAEQAAAAAAAAAASGGKAPGADGAAGAGEAVPAKQKKTRKKRPGKLPQNYNPNIPPDPERWLPRYERAEYKRKHRKRAGVHYQVARGTQGSAGGAAAEALRQQSRTLKSPTAPTSPTSPTKAGGGGGAKSPTPAEPPKEGGAAASAAAKKKKKKKAKKKK